MPSAYTSGHFELTLDASKKPTSSYLKSVDGGFMGHSVVDEAIGAENKRIKHAAVADIDPITFEIGMAGAKDVLKWIQSSWAKDWQTRSGQINHANFNMEKVFEHEFSDALICETTFPTLDGASKEAAYLKVKFQPRAVVTKKVNSTQKLIPNLGPKQKQWVCSAFKLTIDNCEGFEYANKIESFTIKQNVKKVFSGKFRDLELTPTRIEFPNISGTVALDRADNILDWYDTYVVKGHKDPKAQKSGHLDFLSPDRNQTLFRINFTSVGILKAALQPSTANSDQIKRVKFDLYVGDMEIDGDFGLE
jgi:hypothetical protein